MNRMSNPSMEGMYGSIVASPERVEVVATGAGNGSKPAATGNGRKPARTRGQTLSFVIPVKEEEATILQLYRQIAVTVDLLPQFHPFEIIFVDDGSRDASWSIISSIAREHPETVRGIRFRQNAGKAAALTAGFRAARGEVVLTMDADLQDDPAEIPRFLEKLNEGFDIVSGWKRVRHDPWHKVWPSRIFNRMLSRLGGVSLHDHNCGFKCYRAEVVRGLTLYGELHRMVPCLAAMSGFRSGEIEVRHQPRLHGRSKYGFERFLRGFFDMLTVWFFRRFGERPSHLIGTAGFMMFGVGLLLIMATGLFGNFSGGGLVLAVLGAALVAAAPAVLLLGLTTELLDRGGLDHQWHLRIAEDSASRQPDSKADDPYAIPKIPHMPIVESYAYRPEATAASRFPS